MSSRAVLATIAEGTVIPVLSPSLLEELAEVVRRPKFRGLISAEAHAELRDLLTSQGILVTPRHQVRLSRDPDDDHLISLALEAHAAALVTSDKDLLVLHGRLSIPVLSPRPFLRWLAHHGA